MERPKEVTTMTMTTLLPLTHSDAQAYLAALTDAQRDQLREMVLALHPCADAQAWLAGLDPSMTPEAAYAACQRGDWLLWLAVRAGVDRREVVGAACAVARTALGHVPESDQRPLQAIEAAERWAAGGASDTATINAYAAAAAAADAAADAAAAAAYAAGADAAYAAAYAAADAAADAYAAADAAADAAAAYAAADADAAADAARAASLAQSAVIVRSLIHWSVIEAALLAHATTT